MDISFYLAFRAPEDGAMALETYDVIEDEHTACRTFKDEYLGIDASENWLMVRDSKQIIATLASREPIVTNLGFFAF